MERKRKTEEITVRKLENNSTIFGKKQYTEVHTVETDNFPSLLTGQSHQILDYILGSGKLN